MQLFLKNPRFSGLKFPDMSRPETLPKRYVGKLGKRAMQYARGCLAMDPSDRLTSREAVQHPFFEDLLIGYGNMYPAEDAYPANSRGAGRRDHHNSASREESPTMGKDRRRGSTHSSQAEEKLLPSAPSQGVPRLGRFIRGRASEVKEPSAGAATRKHKGKSGAKGKAHHGHHQHSNAHSNTHSNTHSNVHSNAHGAPHGHRWKQREHNGGAEDEWCDDRGGSHWDIKSDIPQLPIGGLPQFGRNTEEQSGRDRRSGHHSQPMHKGSHNEHLHSQAEPKSTPRGSLGLQLNGLGAGAYHSHWQANLHSSRRSKEKKDAERQIQMEREKQREQEIRSFRDFSTKLPKDFKQSEDEEGVEDMPMRSRGHGKEHSPVKTTGITTGSSTGITPHCNAGHTSFFFPSHCLASSSNWLSCSSR
ncbi:unnamed protein product [Chrysoparadoxa australica]